MPTSPSIVPECQDTYLVLDDFGQIGCAGRETDVGDANRETLIREIVEGQYRHPVRIVAFNTTEGWSRDVTVDIADELRRRYDEFGTGLDSRFHRCESSPMARKPLDFPMQVANAFAKDMRAHHAERDAMKRAEIAQRQLDSLQRFMGPRDMELQLHDIIELFEELKD